MWCLCDLPNISDLYTHLGQGWKGGLPLKPRYWFWSLKVDQPPLPSAPDSPAALLEVWRPRGGGACHIREGEVSLEAGGLEATEMMDLLWEKQFLIFMSGPTLLMKSAFA